MMAEIEARKERTVTNALAFRWLLLGYFLDTMYIALPQAV